MAIYIALLRGINVGKNVIKMERVRELWSELGFKNARTYVQSGNVVFEADESASDLSGTIEKKLIGEVRLPVAVIVRTPSELGRVIAKNPFLRDAGVDRSKLHVTFLGATVTKDALKKLSAIDAGVDECRVLGKEVYLHCPNGYGSTKLSNNAIERALETKATTRNWNTVNQLYAMASE